MKELKCPHCQHVFSVDEDMFESLANQVRNAAFQEELERRTAENRKLMQARKTTSANNSANATCAWPKATPAWKPSAAR